MMSFWLGIVVVISEEGFAVIDHKSFVGGPRQVRRQAAEQAGQVVAYASAIRRATGGRLEGCFVHFPLSGQIVALQPSQLALEL